MLERLSNYGEKNKSRKPRATQKLATRKGTEEETEKAGWPPFRLLKEKEIAEN